jgi:hypothetical protein
MRDAIGKIDMQPSNRFAFRYTNKYYLLSSGLGFLLSWTVALLVFGRAADETRPFYRLFGFLGGETSFGFPTASVLGGEFGLCLREWLAISRRNFGVRKR